MNLEQQTQKEVRNKVGSITHSYAVDYRESPKDRPRILYLFGKVITHFYFNKSIKEADKLFFCDMFEREIGE